MGFGLVWARCAAGFPFWVSWVRIRPSPGPAGQVYDQPRMAGHQASITLPGPAMPCHARRCGRGSALPWGHALTTLGLESGDARRYSEPSSVQRPTTRRLETSLLQRPTYRQSSSWPGNIIQAQRLFGDPNYLLVVVAADFPAFPKVYKEALFKAAERAAFKLDVNNEAGGHRSPLALDLGSTRKGRPLLVKVPHPLETT